MANPQGGEVTTMAPTKTGTADKRKSGALWSTSFVIIGLLAVAGGLWWFSHGTRSTRGAEPVPAADTPAGDDQEANIPRVEVVHPRKGGRPRTTTQPGSLHAFEYADLYAKVSGYL